MNKNSNVRRWPALVSIGFVAVVVACSSADGDNPESVSDETDTTSSALWSGYTTSGCSKAEVAKIHDAVGIVLKAGTSGFTAYSNCLKKAGFKENRCMTAQAIANYILKDEVTKFTCKNLPGGAAGQTNGDPPSSKMDLDHSFLADYDKVEVAGTIIHELMHNRKFAHEENPRGSKYYDNTVPLQTEACLTKGTPNPWPGPGSPPTPGCTPPRKCPNTKPYCCEPLANNECIVCAIDNRTCP